MPSSSITRAQAFTYGGVKVGTGTDYALTGVHVFEDTYDELRVAYTVLVQDNTTSSFVTECNALKDAMRTPNSDLKIEYGASTLIDYTQAADTLLNARGSIQVVPGATSNNSILYLCTVIGGRPADETGLNGRQSADYRITTDEAGIDSLEVSARYTATGGTTALSNAQTNFATYAASLQPSGDWDNAAQATYTPDYTNKYCDASIAYRELIHNQSSGTANDAALTSETITVLTQRSSGANDRGQNAKPLVTVIVSFSTAVLHTSTTDLQSKWEAIRGYLITVAENQSGVTGLTVIDENPSPDPTNNRLSGTLTLAGADGSNLLSSQTVMGTVKNLGKVFVPVANGDPLAADVHQGPAVHVIVIQSTILEIDAAGAGSAKAFSAFEAAKRKFLGQGYESTIEEAPIDQRFEHTGQNFSTRLNLRRRQRKVTMRKVNKVNLGGGAPVGASSTRTRTRANEGLPG